MLSLKAKSRLIQLMVAVVLPWGQPSALAQTADRDAVAPSPARLLDTAANFRAALAKALADGTLKPADALQQLAAKADAMGLGLPAAQDRAAALLDVGHRLLAAGHPQEAEAFFSAAEISLSAAIELLADDNAAVKAQLLAQRAFVRERYLNQAAGAEADLERAVTLQPEDRRLQRKRDQLPPAKAGRKADAKTQGGGDRP
jgi:hypothetical protein